jgi:hypothetical protein
MFEDLGVMLEDLKKEGGEYDVAGADLANARKDLSDAQNVVLQKQTAVNAATDAAGKEKKDVVDKCSEMIAKLQEIVTQLQGN